jgi:hypothetical protein
MRFNNASRKASAMCRFDWTSFVTYPWRPPFARRDWLRAQSPRPRPSCAPRITPPRRRGPRGRSQQANAARAHRPVEAPGPQKRRVEVRGAVGGADHEDIGRHRRRLPERPFRQQEAVHDLGHTRAPAHRPRLLVAALQLDEELVHDPGDTLRPPPGPSPARAAPMASICKIKPIAPPSA